MYDVVPGALQRLREADIIRKAGLAVASQGREYCHNGAVHSTKRQGAQLSGIVALSSASSGMGATTTIDAEPLKETSLAPENCSVTVEIGERDAWTFVCACSPPGEGETSPAICAHAAALLYQWLARPLTFLPPDAIVPMLPPVRSAVSSQLSPSVATRSTEAARYRATLRSAAQQVDTGESLALLPLSDLRAIAREYEVAGSGLGKPELVEAIVAALKQPEAVRRVVGALEKNQRQFLATLTLAGGYMPDEEQRGLFERFSFGKGEQYEQMLVALQSKAFLLRAGSNISLQSRLSASLLEMNWFVPPEVRNALHITLPVTSFSVDANETAPTIQHVAPYSLLADLLLVARALDGAHFESVEKTSERSGRINTGNLRSLANLSPDGSIAVPLFIDLPPAALPGTIERPGAFLRFAFRVLRLTDLLYIEDEGAPVLRILPGTSELLLGPTRTEVALELFTHWLRQPTALELHELAAEGLRLRCRAAPSGQPMLRFGELEGENREARETLIALLSQAPLSQWISFPSFARLVYRLNPTFLQRKQRLYPTPHWWIEQEAGRPLNPSLWNDWSRAEGRYLANLVQGPLHWWGATDIALSPEGRLLAFRMTPVAGLLLQGMSLEQDEDMAWEDAFIPPIDCTEQGDLLLRSSPENWSAISCIERFAEVAGVREGRLCYRLTPRSLYEAISQGESFDALLALLWQAAAQPGVSGDALARLASGLETRLSQFGRARLYTDVTLLEVADHVAMRELAATTSIEKQVVKPLSPTLLILRKSGGEQLVEELKRRGQSPLLHEDV